MLWGNTPWIANITFSKNNFPLPPELLKLHAPYLFESLTSLMFDGFYRQISLKCHLYIFTFIQLANAFIQRDLQMPLDLQIKTAL